MVDGIGDVPVGHRVVRRRVLEVSRSFELRRVPRQIELRDDRHSVRVGVIDERPPVVERDRAVVRQAVGHRRERKRERLVIGQVEVEVADLVEVEQHDHVAQETDVVRLAGDVDHHRAERRVRRVVDADAGQAPAVRLAHRELDQRRRAARHAGDGPRPDADPLVDLQSVALVRAVVDELEHDVPVDPPGRSWDAFPSSATSTRRTPRRAARGPRTGRRWSGSPGGAADRRAPRTTRRAGPGRQAVRGPDRSTPGAGRR